MEYGVDTDKDYAELIRQAIAKQLDGDGYSDDELDNLSSYLHPRYKARWEQLIDNRFAVSLDMTDEQLCAYDTGAVPESRQTDRDYYRPASVGIKKRQGSGDRVRTLEQERKHRRKWSKLNRASVDIVGHPADVFVYDESEGVFYYQIQTLKFYTEADCGNRLGWHPDPTKQNNKLVPVKWRVCPKTQRLHITYQGKRIYAHHLAWHMAKDPDWGFERRDRTGDLYFIDGDVTNLKISNLSLKPTTRKVYQARGCVRGKRVCLGSYATIAERDDAVRAFKALKDMGLV